jgi:beta-carotene 3-hydroxylase
MRLRYMFVHDGLVHRRFPVGPLAEMPYMKKLAAAHQLHHSNKYDGAPWGMFLAPQVRVRGMQRRDLSKRSLLNSASICSHFSEPEGGTDAPCMYSVQELESIPGATAELERMAEQLDWSKRS